MGTLPPEELKNAFKTELKLKEKQVKKITQEIYRFVFYPIKEALGEFYSTEILPKSKEGKMSVSKEPEKEESAPPRKDVYKEPIE